LSPSREVIMRRNIDEGELLVVVRSDPFGGVDGALLQRRIDVTPGDLLRHRAEFGHHLSGEAADAELQTAEVLRRLDLFAEPATHLTAGVAGKQGDDVVLLV